MDNPNIYAPPRSNVELKPAECDTPNNILGKLKSQSTWRLLFLSSITLGIYLAHYIKKQTRILNDNLTPEDQISQGLVTFIVILSYITVALLAPYFFFEESYIMEGISSTGDIAWNILVLIWAFKARNRMNSLLSLKPKDSEWFHGFWTFIFTGLYFNYKTNTLNENIHSKLKSK